MSSVDQRVDELGKASRRAALLGLSGVIIVLVSLGYSYYKLEKLRAESTDIEKHISDLKKERDALIKSIAGLQYAAITPQNQVFQIIASAKAIPGRTIGGNPVYTFSAYVNASPELQAKISKVTYDFNHPTFEQPHREAVDPQNKFMVQYVGWGCLSEVDVTVYLKDGSKQSIPFDMCKSLGPDWG